jgi:hypothetical protein
MHSISPYTISSFSREYSDEKGEHYPPLDTIGSFDTYNIFRDYLSGLTSKLKDEESKSFFGFDNIVFDDDARTISGWLETGNYGYGAPIVNILSNKVEFNRSVNNAELIRHFFYLYIPVGMKNGILLTQNFRGKGIKTLIQKVLSDEFKRVTSRVLQVNQLTIKEAYKEWMDGVAKEIKLIGYKPHEDIVDVLTSTGAGEQEFVIKAKRYKSFGKLTDFFKPDTVEAKLVKQLSEHCTAVKAKVMFGGRMRTFKVTVDSENSSTMSDFEFDSKDVEFDEDEQPVYESLLNWTISLCAEIAKEVHGDPAKIGIT